MHSRPSRRLYLPVLAAALLLPSPPLRAGHSPGAKPKGSAVSGFLKGVKGKIDSGISKLKDQHKKAKAVVDDCAKNGCDRPKAKKKCRDACAWCIISCGAGVGFASSKGNKKKRGEKGRKEGKGRDGKKGKKGKKGKDGKKGGGAEVSGPGWTGTGGEGPEEEPDAVRPDSTRHIIAGDLDGLTEEEQGKVLAAEERLRQGQAVDGALLGATDRYGLDIPSVGAGGEVLGGPRSMQSPAEHEDPLRTAGLPAEGVRYGGAGASGGGSASAEAPSPAALLRQASIPDVRRYERSRREDEYGDLLRSGETRLGMHDFQGALSEALKAVERDPDGPKGYLLHAKALNRLGRYKEAEYSAWRALQLRGIGPADSAEAYREMAWAQLNQSRFKDALASVNQSIRLGPGDPKAYLTRAFVYEQTGDRGKMLADLETAARLDPKYAEHLRLARAGQKLFEPGAEDSWRLLEAIQGAPPALDPYVLWGGGAAAGALLLGLVFLLLRRRKKGSAAAPEERVPMPAGEGRLSEGAGLLGGKYQMSRIIGRGGMGQVWEAVDRTLERTVAVKKLTVEGMPGENVRELYLREAQTLAGLHHPNIVDIYEILDAPSGLHMVFELLQGKTVEQMLAERKRLPLEEVKRILKDVCAALAYAHGSGVVHRDLKPSNIMVTDGGHVKVMDFGIARKTGAPPPELGRYSTPFPFTTATPVPVPGGASRTRSIGGTPAYMAPEALQGVVSPAVDVYALGVCLYEMLTGDIPFRSVRRDYLPAARRVPGLPKSVDELVARAVDPAPAKRPAGMRGFASALEAL